MAVGKAVDDLCGIEHVLGQRADASDVHRQLQCSYGEGSHGDDVIRFADVLPDGCATGYVYYSGCWPVLEYWAELASSECDMEHGCEFVQVVPDLQRAVASAPV